MAVTHVIDPGRTFYIVEHPAFLEHVAPSGHPERPDRLIAVEQAIDPFRPYIAPLAPRAASESEILRIHSPEHLRTLWRACEQAPGQLDPDTYVSARSFEVALLAAGAAIDLARSVVRGEASSGIAVVRPPGHHAEAQHAMGFCLFNNVAIAARALQAEEGIEKILILDWDVHHGNGTQHAFEDDPSILYISTHQFPYYPGTGAANELGVEGGTGATLNIPMPAGCGDLEYTGALRRLLVPAALAFRPDALLVSCGFDAHRDDFLASMEISQDGFLEMTRIVRALAREVCGDRLAFVLEGGYALSGLREGMTALLEGLLEPTPSLAAAPGVEKRPGRALRGILDRVCAVHGSRIPGLGAP